MPIRPIAPYWVFKSFNLAITDSNYTKNFVDPSIYDDLRLAGPDLHTLVDISSKFVKVSDSIFKALKKYVLATQPGFLVVSWQIDTRCETVCLVKAQTCNQTDYDNFKFLRFYFNQNTYVNLRSVEYLQNYN